MNHNQADDREVHMEGHREGHQGLGQILHPVPASEGPPTHRVWHWGVRAAEEEVRAHPCRHSGTSISLQGPPVLIHDHRPVHQVVGGCSHQGREYGELCEGAPKPVGGEVRHPRRDHVGSRHPFHIEPVDGTLPAAGYRGAKDNDIQPRS